MGSLEREAFPPQQFGQPPGFEGLLARLIPEKLGGTAADRESVFLVPRTVPGVASETPDAG
ncbi:MAG: hypothetical protein U5L05_15925 [Rubrivivax sp.]|nr:hypothetical protein [Rubrivivax sp.]